MERSDRDAAARIKRDGSRLRRASIRLAAATLGCVLATACTWSSWIPKERPRPLPATAPRSLETLTLGEPHAAVLDCAAQECNHWYRVEVPRAGTLEVLVEPGETTGGSGAPLVRVLVRELGRDPLAQTMGDEDGSLRLAPQVRPGLHLVLVQAGGARLPYTVTVALEPLATGS